MWSLKSDLDKTENWVYVEKAFSAEQCQEIIKLGESMIPHEAPIMVGVDKSVRDSKISWINPSNETNHLFGLMADLVNRINSEFFNFDLSGFAEGFQFTKYEAPAGNYCLHIDKGYNQIRRKLSVVVQLSNPDEYEGGELELQIDKSPTQMKKQQGLVTIFPSYVLHGVKPVTKGTRYSLVAWVTGPAFK